MKQKRSLVSQISINKKHKPESYAIQEASAKIYAEYAFTVDLKDKIFVNISNVRYYTVTTGIYKPIMPISSSIIQQPIKLYCGNVIGHWLYREPCDIVGITDTPNTSVALHIQAQDIELSEKDKSGFHVNPSAKSIGKNIVKVNPKDLTIVFPCDPVDDFSSGLKFYQMQLTITIQKQESTKQALPSDKHHADLPKSPIPTQLSVVPQPTKPTIQPLVPQPAIELLGQPVAKLDQLSIFSTFESRLDQKIDTFLTKLDNRLLSFENRLLTLEGRKTCNLM